MFSARLCTLESPGFGRECNARVRCPPPPPLDVPELIYRAAPSHYCVTRIIAVRIRVTLYARFMYVPRDSNVKQRFVDCSIIVVIVTFRRGSFLPLYTRNKRVRYKTVREWGFWCMRVYRVLDEYRLFFFLLSNKQSMRSACVQNFCFIYTVTTRHAVKAQISRRREKSSRWLTFLRLKSMSRKSNSIPTREFSRTNYEWKLGFPTSTN